jgi:hypothetical protein
MSLPTSRYNVLSTIIFLVLFVFSALGLQQFDNEYLPSQQGYQTQHDVNAAVYANDVLMAETINEFIINRLQNGQYSCPTGWGFPYSYPPQEDRFHTLGKFQRNTKWTPFDRYGSLYAQRHRFREISEVAKQRLEGRGFQVRRLNIFENGKGIYVKWHIKDHSELPKLSDGFGFFKDLFVGPKPPAYEQLYGFNGGHDNLEGQDACEGQPDVICEIGNLIHNVGNLLNP